MSKLRWLVLLAFCWTARADAGLDALHATLTAMRGKPKESGGARGATPQLTVAKHQLRDWVELQLATLGSDGDEIAFERNLNLQLRVGGICDSSAVDTQPGVRWTLLGCAGDVKVYRAREFLVVQTGLGIECGFDESAYLYRRVEESWSRIWENEQDTYTESAYKPQLLERVVVSAADSLSPDHVVLTLGMRPSCISNWHDFDYRAFRTAQDENGFLLVDRTEFAFVDDAETIRGSVTSSDVLIQFETSSIDGGFTPRTAVRHYSITGFTAKRVDPLALGPRDFVDEWISNPRSEVASWTEPGVRDVKPAWHEPSAGFGFIGRTMHCRNEPDLWQVGVKDEASKDKAQNLYFLVRWRPPYRFSMAAVSALPSSACKEEDREADEPRSLFQATLSLVPGANQTE